MGATDDGGGRMIRASEYHGRPTSAVRPSRGRPSHDLTGQRFTRLVAVERAPQIDHRARWRCRCDCGAVLVVLAQCLRNGDQQSCGCLRRELAARIHKRHARAGAKAQRRQSNKTTRVADAFAEVFRVPADTTHVDRPGARVVRGGRY